MAVDIILKKGRGIPPADSLSVGELAIDEATGTVYTLLTSGVVTPITDDGTGANAGVEIGPEPTDPVQGMLWLNEDNQTVYIYDEGNWLEFPASGGSGGGDIGSVTTADVTLTNPTRVPEGLQTQEDANAFIIDSLNKVIDEDGNAIGGDGAAVLTIQDSAPLGVEDGYLWLNSLNGLVYVYDSTAGWFEFPSSGTSGGGGIGDAPADNLVYGRQNSAWTVIQTGDGSGGGNDPRISNQQIINWDASFGWGDHDAVGYLTEETDPTVPLHVKTITEEDIATWNAGGSGVAGVLSFNTRAGAVTLTTADVESVFSESDPVFTASVASGITQDDIDLWNSSGSGGGAVDSVNGKTGVVVLTASDVDALPDTYTAPVDSVNGKTGAVQLSASDVGAAVAGHSHTEYEPKFTKNNAFNKNFGTTSSTVAYGNHTHSNYSASTHGHAASKITSGTFASGTYRFPGAVTAVGDITAYYSSDERLKKNIEPLSGMEILSKLNGYRFTWDMELCSSLEMEQSGEDIGLIAQEVMEVLPEACTVRDNGYMAVRYEKLVPVLIQAINELKKEVEALRDNS